MRAVNLGLVFITVLNARFVGEDPTFGCVCMEDYQTLTEVGGETLHRAIRSEFWLSMIIREFMRTFE